MNKKAKWIIFGTILGILIIFFVPLFPVSLPNMAGTERSLYFFSGLRVVSLGFSFGKLFLIETVGGLVGFLISFIIVGGYD